MLIFNKNFFIYAIFSIFTTFTAFCMDPTKPKKQTQQGKRTRSKSYPVFKTRHDYREHLSTIKRILSDESSEKMDEAIDRGPQNAQQELEPMIQELLTESNQRIAQILQPGSTPLPIDTDQDIIPATFLDSLDLNIKKLTELHGNPSSIIIKEKIFNLLQLNIQTRNQLLQRQEAQHKQLRARLAELDETVKQSHHDYAQHQTEIAKMEDERQVAQKKSEEMIQLHAKEVKERSEQRKSAKEKAEREKKDAARFIIRCICIGVPLAIILPALGFFIYRATR